MSKGKVAAFRSRSMGLGTVLGNTRITPFEFAASLHTVVPEHEVSQKIHGQELTGERTI